MRAVTSTAIAGVSIFTSAAFAVPFNWNVAGGGSWGTASNWVGGNVPDAPGESALIQNTLPSNWPGNLQIVLVNVPISIDQLTMNDFDPPASSLIRLSVDEDSTITTLNWFNDATGSGRSDIYIQNGNVLNVNTMTITGRYPDRLSGVGTGTLRFVPNGGGAANFNYFSRGDGEYSSGGTWDFSQVTSMNLDDQSGAATGVLEMRNTTWQVGNTSANQVWTTDKAVTHIQREVEATNIIKNGGNNLDMGVRTGGSPSGGVIIERATTGDHGGISVRNLFTNTGGGTVAGTTSIHSYRWQQSGNDISQRRFGADRLGSNLVLNGGGITLQARPAGGNTNDVNSFWIQSGLTVTTVGSTGNVLLNDNNGGSIVGNNDGRFGINLQGATLTIGGNLSLLGQTAAAGGSETYLNDGTTGATINVAGNVVVRSGNYLGIPIIDGPGTLGGTAADDFDLNGTALTMNGGATSTFEWRTAAPNAIRGALTAADFDADNFVVDTLTIGAGTTLNYVAGSELFLDAGFNMGAGALLFFPALVDSVTEIHVFDPSGTELAEALGYRNAGQIRAKIQATPGVGFTIYIPEPTTLTLLAGVPAMLLARRRR